MHPAPSIIIFTTLSGLGFGLLFFLGLGLPATTGWVAFVFYAIAFGLAGGGLLSSAFHLGNPQRGLLAFTQWRSSWLSREAWLSVLTLGVMTIFAAGQVFWGAYWWPLGLLGAAGAVATVFATSMIYAQMRTVPRWNHWSTPVLYLAHALAGGALLSGHALSAALLLLALALGQWLGWADGDARFGRSGSSIGTATGLGGLGRVRQWEPPHTGGNYLLDEMVFILGRKHDRKLRWIALGLGYLLPAVLLLLFPATHVLAALAVLSHLAGVFVSRWLFFAQAEHVVGLYYDARRAA